MSYYFHRYVNHRMNNLSYNTFRYALENKYANLSPSQAIIQMCRHYFIENGVVFVANEHVPANIMKNVLSTQWIIGIDCPESHIPAEAFNGMISKDYIRIGSIIMEAGASRDACNGIWKLCTSNLSLLHMKQVPHDTVDVMLATLWTTVKHINIRLQNRAQLMGLCSSLPNLVILVVDFPTNRRPVSLWSFHRCVQHPLKHLEIGCLVSNPISATVNGIKSVTALSIRPAQEFDYDFFAHSTNMYT
jgi:hypothetical protein